jgi:uncharacterized protein (TIGR03437 family)
LNAQGNGSGLPDGVRRGAIRIAFSDGTVSTIDAVLVVSSAEAVSSKPESRRESHTRCDPRELALVFRTPESNFRVTALQPVNIRTEVRDNCGHPLTTGAVRVLAGASESVDLVHEREGVWSRTWVPRAPQSRVTLTASGFIAQGARLVGGQTVISGAILPRAAGAAAIADRVLNSASYLEPGTVSPGSWVAIFGEQLAEAPLPADRVPFPSELGRTQVRLANKALPLYYVSERQINALIPFGLTENTEHQLEIARGETLSVPIEITVSERQPAIYSMNQQGTGQGAILTQDGLLAAPESSSPPSRPVRRGEHIMIFGTGLGRVTNPPADGAPGTGNVVEVPPGVQVGDVSAPVTFAGLAPGLVGVYQVNAVIPESAPAGDAVPVALTVENLRSNTVTIAVR